MDIKSTPALAPNFQIQTPKHFRYRAVAFGIFIIAGSQLNLTCAKTDPFKRTVKQIEQKFEKKYKNNYEDGINIWPMRTSKQEIKQNEDFINQDKKFKKALQKNYENDTSAPTLVKIISHHVEKSSLKKTNKN